MSLKNFSHILVHVSRIPNETTLSVIEGGLAAEEPSDCCRYESDGDQIYMYSRKPVRLEDATSLKELFDSLRGSSLISELHLFLKVHGVEGRKPVRITAGLSGTYAERGDKPGKFSATLTRSIADVRETLERTGVRNPVVDRIVNRVQAALDSIEMDSSEMMPT